jgi:uncharacterized protein (TIGR02679 family)
MSQPAGDCPWCHGACASTDLAVFLGEHVHWFWRQLAEAADRRGDLELVTGTTTVTAPADATQRAAALDLLGGRTPRAGQAVRIDLAHLTDRVRAHHPGLTPGMIAAHAVRRSLAERAKTKARRRDAEQHLYRHMTDAFAALPETAPIRPETNEVWRNLQRTGWLPRLLATDNPTQLTDQAIAVIGALPPAGERCDRRRLADTVTRFPHALDSGTLPALVLAILAASGAVPTGQSPRATWAAVGVDCDDLTGGLLALGIYPAGWALPAHAVVTIPPREIARCAWAPPNRYGSRVFVTENPSVVTAAADRAEQPSTTPGTIKLLCTVGTPSASEIDAIARLAHAGWQVLVRADFDEAGLNHVNALLNGVPTAQPWRMSADDYLASLTDLPPADQAGLRGRTLPETPWDPELRHAMNHRGVPAYEETLIDRLLDDLTDDPQTGPE